LEPTRELGKMCQEHRRKSGDEGELRLRLVNRITACGSESANRGGGHEKSPLLMHPRRGCLVRWTIKTGADNVFPPLPPVDLPVYVNAR
jgi:hypothetical protein